MSELKNSWHTKLAIGILINDEETLDAKLSMLTEIGLSSTNPETFKLCEEHRDFLCRQEDQEKRKDSLPVKRERSLSLDNRQKELNANHGAE